MQALGKNGFARIATCLGAAALFSCILCCQAAARLPTGSPEIDRRIATPIACMKFLPDGASVYVSRKPVVGVWLDHIYIEEADRSCGIKVIYGPFTPPLELQRGHLISFQGEMGTQNNECVVYAKSQIVCDDPDEIGELAPLVMSSQTIMGWPLPPRTTDSPRVWGLIPVGVRVRMWGVVTASGMVDENGYYMYLDDGWGLKDQSPSNAKGVRIYSDAWPNVGTFICATGVLTNKVVYDPTPLGPPGDELIIPTIQCSYDQQPHSVGTGGTPQVVGSVTGRVRLVGQMPPGEPVRIYCQNGVIVIQGATDEFVPYVLHGVSGQGCPVSASAPGYISYTRIARAGDTGVDFELVAAQKTIEISSDRSSVPVCSDASATIFAMARDSEGKPFNSGGIKFTTTKGVFVESGSKEIVISVGAQGQGSVHLNAGADSPSVAHVTASSYPGPEVSNSIDIQLKGPDILVTADTLLLTAPGTSHVAAHLTAEDAALSGALVRFETDHGTFQQTGTNQYQCLTNGQGIAEATLQIDSPGTATVRAYYVNSCSNTVSNWVSVAYASQPWFAASMRDSNPLVVDLDGQDSGKKEVVVLTAGGDLVTLASEGNLVWFSTIHPVGTNTPSCAILDGDPSARPSVFIPSDAAQKVYAFTHDGQKLAGWPVGSNYRFLTVAAAIGDLNRDGSPEVVCGDESCYVFAWNPTGDWKKNGNWDSSFLWRNVTAGPSIAIYHSTCALGDLDNDPEGMLDVAVGSNHTEQFFAFPGNLWGDFGYDPVYVDCYPKATEGRVRCSPAIGDIDGDGLNDLAVGSDDEKLYIWLSSDQSWKGYPAGGPVKSSPALFDIDGDGKLDVIVGSLDGRLLAFNWQGRAPDGWTDGIRLNSSGIYGIESSPVVGDVDGDGEPEMVVGCNDGNIYAVYRHGTENKKNGVPTGPIAWTRSCVPPGATSVKVLSSPVIDDLDADGKVEVVASGTEGVYVFHFDAPYTGDPQHYPWPTFHRDNQRTGCTTPPPGPTYGSIQGLVRKNGAGVLDAKVYIAHSDGSPVYEPHSNPPVARGHVLTVGTAGVEEARKGAYCINQLPPNSTYKLTIEAPGEPVKVVDGIAVTTGLVRVNIDL